MLPSLPIIRRKSFLPLLVAIFAAILVAKDSAEAFEIRTQASVSNLAFGNRATTTKSPRRTLLHERIDGSDDAPILSSSSPNAAMSETSRLSHAMLKVPSVDDSVEYLTSMGGRIVRSKSNGKTNGEARLLSAFVQLGPVGGGKRKDQDGESVNNEDDSQSFSLEIVQGPTEKPKNRPHHGLSYLGLSMLLKFQNKNRLLELMMGKSNEESKDSPEEKDDNNEHDFFPVKYVASAPGDGIAQLALLSDDKLVETCDFYTNVLGMDQKAQDAKLLCLRYDGNAPTGVATTLVFENKPSSESNESDESGGCFDHLAINTTSSVDGLYQSILEENKSEETNPVKIYMKPTQMFGSTILGLIDPNGYRVVVFGSE